MRAGAQQARIVVNNQIHRDRVYIVFETTFVFEPAAEAGRFKELKEARHNATRNVHAAESAQRQR